MDVILSVDLGTTAIKTCLLDASGHLLAGRYGAGAVS